MLGNGNRELKGQIEELAQQQQMVTQQLQQIRQLIQDKENQQNQQNQNSSQSQQSLGNAALGGYIGSPHTSEIANELLKLKGMANDLEKKMKQYISSQSGQSSQSSQSCQSSQSAQSSQSSGTMSQEAVVTLILNMMDGMMDWTIDYVSNPRQNQNTN